MAKDESDCVELIRELKRTQGTGAITRYGRETIEQTIHEIDSLYSKVQNTIRDNPDLIRTDPSFSCAITTHYSTIMRQKRILLAYLFERLKRIQRIRWDIGSVLPQEIKENMGEPETDFYQDYDQLLGKYMAGVGIDVTADLSPPTDLLIEVRVLESYGEIYTSNGVVNLEKNTTHFLPRSDVEGLIRRGVLEHII